ncbi:HIT family protein [Candidatus Woesearchaeota archaeon]|nr:HIT family protein [Candidatus Woesearchaeota archaeon]
MELSPEQKTMLEEQKKQCIFCQIVEGKIPSKKVYEDNLLVAVLDINPASKGHVLLMPKEHYPIMPLIPPETFKHMFDKVKAVEGAIKDALLCKETTVFIANGGAAGQQSNHFMLHIIPREGGDELDMLDIKGKDPIENEVKEVNDKIGPALQAMLGRNLPAMGYTKQGTMPPQKLGKEQLLKVIDSNPQVKQLILTKPEQFKQLVPQHPQLSQLFKDVDIDDIISAVKARSAPKAPGKLGLEGVLK